jgi:hypothetical protein
LPRMIELIRQSAVPAGIMRAAAKGALSLPAAEMFEILVHLCAHSSFGPQAQLTLAGWDEASAREIASDPNTPWPVLDYISTPANVRPALLPALLENPSLPDARVQEIAMAAGGDAAAALAASRRVRQSPQLLRALAANPGLGARESAEVKALLDQPIGEFPRDEELFADEISGYLREHEEQIQAAEGTPFSLFGLSLDEQAEMASAALPAAIPVAGSAATGPAPRADKSAQERQHLSTVQKIATLSVGDRVQLALKGNKDERFVLVRDGVKVVCTAVIDSPKVTDAEVEMFASMKNVSDTVLRSIAAKRKFIKSYTVIRNLTSNPRCPIDVSVPLLPHLMSLDLKGLSSNKNVPDVVRKTSLKMFRDRLSGHRS